MTDRYKYTDGYKRQLELAGVMWDKDVSVVVARVQAVGTYRAWRALRAMFKSYGWEYREYPEWIERFNRMAQRAELRAEQIKFEAR